MEYRSNKALVAFCWVWAALVTAYIGWSWLTFSGLYRWLAEFQIEKWGSYYTAMTGFVPWFILAGPAFSYAGKEARMRRALSPNAPEQVAAGERRTAKWMAIIGVVSILVGFGSYTLSQRVPDGSEPATPLDIAALETAPPPVAKVSIKGEIIPEISSAIAEKSDTIDINTGYVAFVPEGTDPKAPPRFFVQRGLGTTAEVGRVTQAFLPEQTGYLMKDGLPPIVLSDFEKRGIKIASPHYLLDPGSNARRDNYYIVAALGGFLGFILLLTAAVGAIRSRNK